MKTPITKNMLKGKVTAEKKSSLAIILIPVLFALACILLIPVKAIGIGIAAVVLLLVFLFLRKLRQAEPTGDPEKAYLSRRAVTKKTEEQSADPDSAGNAYSRKYYLDFDDQYAEVDAREFEKAQPGDLYYVAFFSENGRAFACFRCEDYEPDGTVEVR